MWSSASPRAYLGLLSYLICKSEGSVGRDVGGLCIEGLSSFTVVATVLLGKQPDAGKEVVSPGSLGAGSRGTRGLGAILSVLTACRPVFFHPPLGCSIFIHSAIQPIFTNIYVIHACLLSSLLTGHQEAQMAGLT